MDEYAEVPVHGRNLGWASSQLGSAGVPYSMAGRQGGGVYVILVPMAYMPMVAGAPWVYQQPGRLAGLAAVPWVRIVLAIGFMAAVVYSCQAFGMMAGFASLVTNPEVQAAAKAQEEDRSTLDKLADAISGMKADVDKQIEQRTQEAQQGFVQATINTAITVCAAPALVLFAVAAAWLGLRIYRARRGAK